ncbi:MAG: homocysteine S-methyltransferase family protein [Actinomycetota bacterium]
MSVAEHRLPQASGAPFLTDGGIETTLIYRDGFELPEFAAFDLLRTERGSDALRRYYRSFAQIAAARGTGFIYESPTWRANPDWAARIGYDKHALDSATRAAIQLLKDVRREVSIGEPTVLSGCVGPRGDGYRADRKMSRSEASVYHAHQIATMAEEGVDMVCAITMNYVEEAIGIADAAFANDMPVAISFTVETDGRLPTGHSLQNAISLVDDATDGRVAYYMINCAHPSHLETALDGEGWTNRIRGLRANASALSHAELDEATELDDGDPHDLAERHGTLLSRLPELNILGGCCGTDERHVSMVADRCLPLLRKDQ